MDQLVKSAPSSEYVTSKDSYCNDDVLGCLKVPFTDFVRFVKSISGVSLTKDDLSNWLKEDYIYTDYPTDAISGWAFTVDSVSILDGKYNVVINSGNYQNEIVIKSTLEDLRNLSGVIECKIIDDKRTWSSFVFC